MSEAETGVEPVEAPPSHRPSSLLTVVVATVWVVVDQLTKRWALDTLVPGEPQHVVWTLQWNLSFNSGMAFGTGTGFGPVIGVFALAVVIWLAASVRHVDSRIARVAAGMVVGGAIGNIIDRLTRGDGLLDGAVVDFIDLQWFPWIFNIADMGITVGGALFIVWSLTTRKVTG